MKVLLLILALAVSVSAQEPVEGITDWKFIKEVSGKIIGHPELTVEVYAARFSTGNGKIKLITRFDFPNGAPVDVFRHNVPVGFDVSSIKRMIFKWEFNCNTLVMKAVKNSGEVIQFNGKRHKSKEPPFNVDSGNLFVNYFCERPSTPSTKTPTLKQKGPSE